MHYVTRKLTERGSFFLNYYVLNRGDDYSLQLTETFHTLAAQHNMTLDEHNPDIVLSIGGDGTLLEAFHMFKEKLHQVAFVGIHTGRLGFYADWKPEEIEELVQRISESKHLDGTIAHYPLAELHITTEEQSHHYLALNEFTIKSMIGTLVAELHINNELFETFRGDGILISTPSGSTAYNKSLGGALVHPSLATLQITEMASINNRVFRTLGSPIILPQHHFSDILPKIKQPILLSIDHLHVELKDVISIRCTVAAEKVRFARFRPFPFWNRVRGAFISNEGDSD